MLVGRCAAQPGATQGAEPLADHDAITQLFATYAWAHDNKEFELLDGVFTEVSDFTVDITGGATIGPLRLRQETVDFIRDTTIDQGDQRRHVITNVRFSNESDQETRVTAILSLFVTLDNELTVQATGWYDCQAVLDDGAWRFASMYLTLDRTYES
jgi:3-phenylpropionate/cinnamic acid dioxygenase small subunit